MKKLVLFLISALFALFVLVACGGEPATPLPPPEVQLVPETPASDITIQPDDTDLPDNNDLPDEATIPDEPQAPEGFFFKIGDAVVELNENITYVINAVGEPIVPPLELPSCAFDGMDIVFRYPGVDLYTYPVGDDDFVYNIAFFDDTVRTAEGGIRLGSSLQDVLDVYGDDYELDSGMYTFTRGLTVLEFLVSDDTVIGITYRFLVEI